MGGLVDVVFEYESSSPKIVFILKVNNKARPQMRDVPSFGPFLGVAGSAKIFDDFIVLGEYNSE